MTDTTAGTCPVCGGRLCVDTQYPDRIYCDTCEYEWPDGDEPFPPRKERFMTMRLYEGFGPLGRMETMAVSPRKAESNLRYRLHRECGLSVYEAARYDLSPIREVKR